MNTEVLAKFEVRLENVSVNNEKPILMVSFYEYSINGVGGYIGNVDDFKHLVIERGIVPEVIDIDYKVCSIGKSVKDGKWYGWSHRAIYGFKIGDKVKAGDCCASSGLTDEYLKKNPEENKSLPIGFIAETEEDCKLMAIAFANSVS